MNTIDLLVLVVTAFNLILGAIRGAVWQGLRIASIVLGIWAAIRYGEEVLAMFPASLGLADGKESCGSARGVVRAGSAAGEHAGGAASR